MLCGKRLAWRKFASKIFRKLFIRYSYYSTFLFEITKNWNRYLDFICTKWYEADSIYGRVREMVFRFMVIFGIQRTMNKAIAFGNLHKERILPNKLKHSVTNQISFNRRWYSASVILCS